MAGPAGMTVIKRGQHVVTHWISPQIFVVHGVDHLRGHEHGHGGAFGHIFSDVLSKISRQQRTHHGSEFFQVFDGVLALP